MEIITQVSAVLGPIILAFMGLYVSVKPPKKKGRGHWVWFGAFGLIGLGAAAANFRELSSADANQEENKHTLARIAAAVGVDANTPSGTTADKIVAAINEAVRKAQRGSRDPNKIYQDNHEIGTVVSGHKNGEEIFFDTLKPIAEINFSKEIELRDFRISCKPSEPITMSVNGPLREIMYQNVECHILGQLQ